MLVLPAGRLSDAQVDALHEEIRLVLVKEACKTDPKALLAEMKGFDPTTQEYFQFDMSGQGEERIGDDGWGWQADVIDWWNDPKMRKFLMLKARQLGITWLAVAYGLWHMLFKPGSNVVCYSHDLPAAKKLIMRAWVMFLSIPEYLRNHVEVVTPRRSELPSEIIRLRDKATGKYSIFQALAATEKAGHGDTVTLGIMDELSRAEYAKGIWEALNPATSRGGRLLGISTANGVSNPETGAGNFFHRLWYEQEARNLNAMFLPWYSHPERGGDGIENRPDPGWYEREALALDEVDRNRQYPRTAEDAFTLSGDMFFDRQALDFYRRNPSKIIRRGQFVAISYQQARFADIPRDGIIEQYERPKEGHTYAISADTATGKGLDFSVAHVIDLQTGEIVAKLRCKIEIPRYGYQLYWLAKWYSPESPAIIFPERQGGWGEALIIDLKDGTQTHPAWSRIYRHKGFTKAKKPIAEEYGYPMSESNRGHILSQLGEALRVHFWPWLPKNTTAELGTFVHREERPSPRAQDGSHDDEVISLALAREAYKQYGSSPAKVARDRKWKQKDTYQPSPTRRY